MKQVMCSYAMQYHNRSLVLQCLLLKRLVYQYRMSIEVYVCEIESCSFVIFFQP